MRTNPCERFATRALVLVLAILATGCLDHSVTVSFILNGDGSGSATLEARGSSPLASISAATEAVDKARADLTKEGWVVIEDQRSADGFSIRAGRNFKSCSELADVLTEGARVQCQSTHVHGFRRLHEFRLEGAKPLQSGLNLKTRVRLPGQVDDTNGTVTPGGEVEWEGVPPGGTFVAVSSEPGPAFLGSKDPRVVVPAVASLILALAGVVLLVRSRPSTAQCAHCGAELEETARFCRGCGRSRGATPSRMSGRRLALALIALAGGIALWQLQPASPHELAQAILKANTWEALNELRPRVLSGAALAMDSVVLVQRLKPNGDARFDEIKTASVADVVQVSTNMTTRWGGVASIQFTARKNRSGAWRISDIAEPRFQGGDDAKRGDAVCRQRVNGSSEGLALLNRAVTANPKDGWFRILLGDCLTRAADVTAACSAYRKAVELAPDSLPEARVAAAGCLPRTDPEVERLLREALRVSPDHGDASWYLAFVLADSKRSFEEAEQLAVKAEQADPLGRGIRAFVLLQQGRKEEAARLLRELPPVEFDASSSIASLKTGLRDGWLRRAEATATSVIQNARLEMQRGDVSAAMQTLDEFLKDEPDDSEVVNARQALMAYAVEEVRRQAEALLGRAQYDAALRRCDEALVWAPQDAALIALRERIRRTKEILES